MSTLTPLRAATSRMASRKGPTYSPFSFHFHGLEMVSLNAITNGLGSWAKKTAEIPAKNSTDIENRILEFFIEWLFRRSSSKQWLGTVEKRRVVFTQTVKERISQRYQVYPCDRKQILKKGGMSRTNQKGRVYVLPFWKNKPARVKRRLDLLIHFSAETGTNCQVQVLSMPFARTTFAPLKTLP